MALPIPVVPDDMPFIHGCFREVFEQDRALHGYPTMDIYIQSDANVDPLSGTYTPQTTTLFTGVECHYRFVGDEQIANSGGLVLQGDETVTCYGLGGIINDRAIIKLMPANRHCRIVNQSYNNFNGRSIFLVRQIKET